MRLLVLGLHKLEKILSEKKTKLILPPGVESPSKKDDDDMDLTFDDEDGDGDDRSSDDLSKKYGTGQHKPQANPTKKKLTLGQKIKKQAGIEKAAAKDMLKPTALIKGAGAATRAMVKKTGQLGRKWVGGVPKGPG